MLVRAIVVPLRRMKSIENIRTIYLTKPLLEIDRKYPLKKDFSYRSSGGFNGNEKRRANRHAKRQALPIQLLPLMGR
jgi:hypothetical protein